MVSIHIGHNRHRKILSLFQECVCSVIASVFAVLLMRWLTLPVSGFAHIALLWVIASLIATSVSSWISGSYKTASDYLTPRSLLIVLGTVCLKEMLLLLVLCLSRRFRFGISSMSILLLADALFSSIAMCYPLVVGRLSTKYRTMNITDMASRPNVFVQGYDADAINLADRLASSGDYNVLGLLSDSRSMEGMQIGDYKVCYYKDKEDMDDLNWRFGGVDCIFFPLHETKSDIEDARQKHQDSMTSSGKFLKRSFDLVGSAVLMLLFFPLALMSALAILADDGGPILYRQERIGKDGRPFNILKFRTMRTDAEAGGAKLWSGENDPRLTKSGSFLRRHHLDELPQLWNVFVGDMSFVGYRPERIFFINQIAERNPRYHYLYQIRPGVTSYATLYNGYTDSLEKMLVRLDLDLYYLRHHSVAFDLKVLWLTFYSIVSGKEF